MKKFGIIFITACIHFGLSALIVPGAMSVATGIDMATAGAQLWFQLFVVATRILHFPIISLSLYSRHWFPGAWIYIPIFTNSLLWAVVIYFLVVLGRKIFKGRYANGRAN